MYRYGIMFFQQKYFIFIVEFFIFLTISNLARAENTQLPNEPIQISRQFSTELKLTVSPPVIAGYGFGVEGVLGFEIRELAALDLRYVHFASLPLVNERSMSGEIINTSFGLYPFKRDNRVNNKGWVGKNGLFLGYQLLFGNDKGVDIEDNVDVRYHYITGTISYKAIHWWSRNIGFVFQANLTGAVSFYSYESAHNCDEDYGCSYPEKKGFDFADKFMGGLQLYVGVAF